MKYIPIQILTWAIAAIYIFIGKALAPLMVFIGMLLGWPKICWPWDNFANKGNYADGGWYRREHWSWQIGAPFAEWWWRAIRNGFSNGARYAIKNSFTDDVWKHPGYHEGHYKGPAKWAFPHQEAPYPKTLFRYEYDKKRPYLSRYVFTWFASDARYFMFYAGFKFDRVEGFGFSIRCWYYKNET